MDGRTASVAFQLEVVDKMVAAVVFVAVEPCKTFAVETEARGEEQMSTKDDKINAIEMHQKKVGEKALNFDCF